MHYLLNLLRQSQIKLKIATKNKAAVLTFIPYHSQSYNKNLPLINNI